MVSQSRVEAVRDGRAEAKSSGLYKRMQNEVREQLKGEAVKAFTAADWLWEWVRQAQAEEKISCDAARHRRGGGAEMAEGWREALRLDRRGRWECYKRSVAAAVRKLAVDLGDGSVRLLRVNYTAVAQTVKKRAPGRAALSLKLALWDLAATEGMEVELQGEDEAVSGSWSRADWWRSAIEPLGHCLTQGEVTGLQELGERVMGWARAEAAVGEGRRCLVHWFSGWGSGVSKAAAAAGLEVISVELQEDRVRTAGGVKVQLDIGTVAPRWLIPEVAMKADRAVCELLAHWGGPPCQTLAAADGSNDRKDKVTGQRRQWNFRVRSDPEKAPAHPEGNWRGDAAREGDRLSTFLLRALRGEAIWAVENPLALLRDRPTYKSIEDLLHRVDYCAYWTEEERVGKKGYQKMTCVWTAVEWEPEGSTGTGRCMDECECGWREDGQWHHHGMQDQKSKQVKCRVPERLVLEWLRAAGLH